MSEGNLEKDRARESGGMPAMFLLVPLIAGLGSIGAGAALALRNPPASPAVIALLVVAGLISTVVPLLLLDRRLKKARIRGLVAALDGYAMSFFELGRSDSPSSDAWRPFAALKDLKTGGVGVQWYASGELDKRESHLLYHRYTVNSGKHSTTYHHACYAVRCPDQWPGLSLTSEHLGHKLLGLFGKKDLQLEDKRFNDRWRIATDDEDFAILLLNPEIQELLREPDKTAGRSAAWHIGEGWIRLVIDGNPSPEAVGAALERLRVLRLTIASELDAYSG